MRTTFTIDGATHEFDLDKMTFAEGRAIEKVTGGTFKEFGQLMQSGSLTALQALAWVAIKRDLPTTKFSDLDERAIGDLTIDTDEVPATDPQIAAGAPAA